MNKKAKKKPSRARARASDKINDRIYALEMRIKAPYDLSMRMARLEEGIKCVEARYIPHGGTVSPTLAEKRTVADTDSDAMYRSPTPLDTANMFESWNGYIIEDIEGWRLKLITWLIRKLNGCINFTKIKGKFNSIEMEGL